MSSLAVVVCLNCCLLGFSEAPSFGQTAQMPQDVWHLRSVLTRQWQQACCSPGMTNPHAQPVTDPC